MPRDRTLVSDDERDNALVEIVEFAKDVNIKLSKKNWGKNYVQKDDTKTNGYYIVLARPTVKGVESWFSMSIMKTQEDLVDDSYTTYLNSDGDTIIYNERTESSSYTEKQRVSPKQGRVVIFEGGQYHTAEQPTKGTRCIVNYNLDYYDTEL